jgi:hypothetical protein
MDPSLLFTLCNTSVMPFWALLIFAPGWSWTQRLVHSILMPTLLGAVYASLLLIGPSPPEGAGFGSLSGVMALFSVPEAVLGGWVHYLVFDLFVGAWIVRDSRRREIAHLLVVPCVLCTLMLGPLGLLLYSALRGVLRRTETLDETQNAAAAVA